MKYQKYPEYKESGIEWLGEVPKHWEIKPIKSLFSRTKRTGYKNETLLSVYREYGVIVKSSRDDNRNKESDDLSPYQLVNIGDLVINKMKAWQGSLAISEHRGIVSPAYYIYEPLNSNNLLNNNFVHNQIRSKYFIQSYKNFSKGIRVGQWDLESELFTRLNLFLPPFDEQRKISEFIQREITKIDNLISKQEQLIKLLEEQRKSIILHAVTKGLNPNAPMKDSGVEWLGEVPRHWKISKIKYLSQCLDSKRIPLNSVERSLRSGSIPYWGANNIVDCIDDYLFDENLILVGEDGAPFFDPLKNVAFFVSGKIWVNNHMHVLRPLPNLTNIHFLTHAINSTLFRYYVSGSTRDKLNQTDLNNILIRLPELNEQNIIADFLTKEIEKINTLISKQKQLIEKLKEYRTSIISHAVTGKIDVREAL